MADRMLKLMANLTNLTSGADLHKLQKRACGSCTACCTVMGVHDLESGPKERQVRCDHEVERGCSIYDKRPESCREFYCAWSCAMVPASMRPDRTGLVVWIHVTSVGVAWFMDECRPGALASVQAKRLIRELSEERPMLV